MLEKILYSSPACIPAKYSFYSQKKDIFMNPLALSCHARLCCQGQAVQDSRESGQGAGGEQGHGPSQAGEDGGRRPPSRLPGPKQGSRFLIRPRKRTPAQFSLWVGGASTGLAGRLRQKAEGRLSPGLPRWCPEAARTKWQCWVRRAERVLGSHGRLPPARRGPS